MSNKYEIIKISLLTAVVTIGVAGTFVVFAAPGLANMAYALPIHATSSISPIAAGGPPYLGCGGLFGGGPRGG